MYIQRNAVLTSPPDFRNLRIIVGELNMNSNAELRSLPAFSALRSVGTITSSTHPISITGNFNLSMCCGLFPFVQRPLPPGFTLGASGMTNISSGVLGSCKNVADIRGSECFLRVNTSGERANRPAPGRRYVQRAPHLYRHHHRMGRLYGRLR